MPTDPNADELRRRAAGLRRLAARLDDVPLSALRQWSGPDTWSSPAADECRHLLGDDVQTIRRAVTELGEQAFRFERQADTLDAVAAAAVAAPIQPVLRVR